MSKNDIIYDNEIEIMINMIIKLYIIVNAIRLGWKVEVRTGMLILTKRLDKLTKLDKNTPRLIKELLKNEII
jgi:hypothetical protein